MAEQLGMESGEDVDQSAVFHRTKASRRKGAILGWLHRLRYLRAQDHLPVELEVRHPSQVSVATTVIVFGADW